MLATFSSINSIVSLLGLSNSKKRFVARLQGFSKLCDGKKLQPLQQKITRFFELDSPSKLTMEFMNSLSLRSALLLRLSLSLSNRRQLPKVTSWSLWVTYTG